MDRLYENPLSRLGGLLPAFNINIHHIHDRSACITNKQYTFMIKCNVTVCGVMSRDAILRNGKEGKQFVSMTLQTAIHGKDGQCGTVEISVSQDGTQEESARLRSGMRVKATGMLVPKHRGDKTYLNLSADSIVPAGADETDSLKGELTFRGKVGKTIDERTDKNGKPFFSFSAFSAEKVNDNFEYLWVRFFCFGKQREAWLQPGTKIDAKGEMELSLYNGKADITCRAEEITQYVPTPNNN